MTSSTHHHRTPRYRRPNCVWITRPVVRATRSCFRWLPLCAVFSVPPPWRICPSRYCTGIDRQWILSIQWYPERDYPSSSSTMFNSIRQYPPAYPWRSFVIVVAERQRRVDWLVQWLHDQRPLKPRRIRGKYRWFMLLLFFFFLVLPSLLPIYL